MSASKVRSVIIQARMGSTRLPGKVLKLLGGKTVLWHVITRCRAIPNIDVVCCAVSEGKESDPVAEEARICGAAVVRGPEQDVLARYFKAADEISADTILRVTSDCPLCDPAVCGEVLTLLEKNDLDYACNNMPPSFPHGLDCEAFTRNTLERAHREAQAPDEREHVTPWMRAQPGILRKSLVGPKTDIAGLRWTLDYPEDIAFFVALFEHLPPSPAMPGYDDVLKVLEQHPEITAINAGCVDANRPGMQAIRNTGYQYDH